MNLPDIWSQVQLRSQMIDYNLSLALATLGETNMSPPVSIPIAVSQKGTGTGTTPIGLGSVGPITSSRDSSSVSGSGIGYSPPTLNRAHSDGGAVNSNYSSSFSYSTAPKRYDNNSNVATPLQGQGQGYGTPRNVSSSSSSGTGTGRYQNSNSNSSSNVGPGSRIPKYQSAGLQRQNSAPSYSGNRR